MASPGDLLLIARPPIHTREELVAAIEPVDLQKQLGPTLFPMHNLHQSLSSVYSPDMREKLLEASASIQAHAFVMQLDRIRSNGTVPGSIHWELFPSSGKPQGLSDLLEAREAAFLAHGIHDRFGHSAHLTISYFARKTLRAPLRFQSVIWVIDAIELVQIRGSGRDYHYQTIATWPLAPLREAIPTISDLLI